MEPTVIAAGLPVATSWYMNPYFMASFGAVVALGFVLFTLAYFVFVKLKVGQPTLPIVINSDDKCANCGLTTEMLTKMIPCKDHSAVLVRLDSVEKWQGRHDEDYRELQRRVNTLEREGRK